MVELEFGFEVFPGRSLPSLPQKPPVPAPALHPRCAGTVVWWFLLLLKTPEASLPLDRRSADAGDSSGVAEVERDIVTR